MPKDATPLRIHTVQDLNRYWLDVAHRRIAEGRNDTGFIADVLGVTQSTRKRWATAAEKNKAPTNVAE